jgi:hypothetical protein
MVIWLRFHVIPWIESWFVCFWCNSPQWARASSFMSFLDHTRRHTTISRTPLDEWSARRRDLYLTTHNTHNRQTSMPSDEIWTHNLGRRAAADLCPRPRGHWDRRKLVYCNKLDITVLLKIITGLCMSYNCNMEGNCIRFYIAKWMSIEILRLTIYTQFLWEPSYCLA